MEAEKNYTITLTEPQARIVHKIVQDYLLRREHSGEYGWHLMTAEIALTQQLFEGQGMKPGKDCYCDPEQRGLLCKYCSGKME